MRILISLNILNGIKIYQSFVYRIVDKKTDPAVEQINHVVNSTECFAMMHATIKAVLLNYCQLQFSSQA